MLFKQIEIHNARALLPAPGGQGDRISRVPESLRAQLNPGAQNACQYTAGVELRFNIRSGKARLVLRRDADEAVGPYGVGEVWFGPFQGPYRLCPAVIAPTPTELIIEMPPQLEMLCRLAESERLSFDPRLVRVLLPYDYYTELIAVEGDLEPPLLEQFPARKLLTYGSSITHGGSAIRPSETYAMQTAARLGCDLLNLGMAGSAHMEAEMGTFIAEGEDWEMAVLEMGINVLDWPVEQFAARTLEFVHRIASPHSDRWVFCIDLFTCEADLNGDPRPAAFRQVVREVVRYLNLPKLVHLDGRSLLPTPEGLSTDLVHPSVVGMETIAQNLTRAIQARLDFEHL